MSAADCPGPETDHREPDVDTRQSPSGGWADLVADLGRPGPDECGPYPL